MRVTINPTLPAEIGASQHTVDPPPEATVENVLCLYTVVFN